MGYCDRETGYTTTLCAFMMNSPFYWWFAAAFAIIEPLSLTLGLAGSSGCANVEKGSPDRLVTDSPALVGKLKGVVVLVCCVEGCNYINFHHCLFRGNCNGNGRCISIGQAAEQYVSRTCFPFCVVFLAADVS